MTVDASRSCLGLATSIGSEIRQIVVSRVLLTAAAPPALPGRACSKRLKESHKFTRLLLGKADMRVERTGFEPSVPP